MTIDQFELGYTPNNLKALLKQHKLTQKQCAELLGVGLNAVQKWCADPFLPSHRTMPHDKWLELLESFFGSIES